MRIEATELVAHGLLCDNSACEKIVPVRNAQSRAEGYYVKAMRVTGALHANATPELFFCSKEHMLEALQWQFSSMATEEGWA